jgi:hypothetical protein
MDFPILWVCPDATLHGYGRVDAEQPPESSWFRRRFQLFRKLLWTLTNVRGANPSSRS